MTFRSREGLFEFLKNYQDKKLQHMIDERGRNTRYSEGSIDEQVRVYNAKVNIFSHRLGQWFCLISPMCIEVLLVVLKVELQ